MVLGIGDVSAPVLKARVKYSGRTPYFKGLIDEAFEFYVTRIASFGVLYGSVAAPLLVILWTFYSANIFLYAASVSASIQARHNKALASRTPRE